MPAVSSGEDTNSAKSSMSIVLGLLAIKMEIEQMRAEMRTVREFKMQACKGIQGLSMDREPSRSRTYGIRPA
jgi:hypothetical protein